MHFIHLMNTEKCVANTPSLFLICKSLSWNKVAVCVGWRVMASFFGSSICIQVHTGTLFFLLQCPLVLIEDFCDELWMCRKCLIGVQIFAIGISGSLIFFTIYASIWALNLFSNPICTSLNHYLPLLKVNVCLIWNMWF